MKPVWKDSDVKINNVTTSYQYGVEPYNEDRVYNGVAVPKPGNNFVEIRLSDFAKNIVNSDATNFNLDYNTNWYNMPNYVKNIIVVDGDGRIADSEYFYNSYDYNNVDFSEDAAYIIGEPIKKKIYNNGGIYLFSIFNTTDSESDWHIYYDYGDENMEYLWEGDYIDAYTAMVVKISNLPTSGKLVISGLGGILAEYEIVESCNRYNLHYQNAAGGYSTISIDGKRDKRTDNLEFNYYKCRGNNTDYLNPQMVKYNTNITPKWELQTGWITDDESSRMYNIFTSQKVWLEDTENNKIYPVYITNNAVEYKTFTNQGKKKYNYSISVTLANTFIKL